jgi:hypothetical protein
MITGEDLETVVSQLLLEIRTNRARVLHQQDRPAGHGPTLATSPASA